MSALSGFHSRAGNQVDLDELHRANPGCPPMGTAPVPGSFPHCRGKTLSPEKTLSQAQVGVIQKDCREKSKDFTLPLFQLKKKNKET